MSVQGGSVEIAYLMQGDKLIQLEAYADIVWVDSDKVAELEFEPTIDELRALVSVGDPSVRVASLQEALDSIEN